MKAVVGAFNQEKALVGAFSVITNLHMELFEALIHTHKLGMYGLPVPPDNLKLGGTSHFQSGECFYTESGGTKM